MKKYYVCGFLFSEDYSRIVMIKKNKPEWQKNFLNGVGGKIELFDDSPELAQKREFLEEAGLEINDWKQFLKLEGESSVVYFFYSTGNVDAIKSMEEEEVFAYNTDYILNNFDQCVPNIKWILPLLLTNDKFTGEIKIGE
ncbi:MAG: NUDIX domain-containing protein [Bacteroidia bacterium]